MRHHFGLWAHVLSSEAVKMQLQLGQWHAGGLAKVPRRALTMLPDSPGCPGACDSGGALRDRRADPGMQQPGREVLFTLGSGIIQPNTSCSASVATS